MKNILEYKGFLSTINYSSEDEVLYGKIEGINDLVSFEGESVKELKKTFKEAVEDYLETCSELGKNPLKTYNGSFNIRVKPEIHEKAVYKAKTQNISLNKFVEKAIEEKICK